MSADTKDLFSAEPTAGATPDTTPNAAQAAHAALIEAGALREAIEHAPAVGHVAPSLMGVWTPAGWWVCGPCVGRIMARGMGHLMRHAEQIWKNEGTDGEAAPLSPPFSGPLGICITCEVAPLPPVGKVSEGPPPAYGDPVPLWQVARDAYEKNNPDAADAYGQWEPGTPAGVTGDSLYEFVCNEVEDVTEGIEDDDPHHEGRVIAAREAHEALDRAVLQLMEVRNAMANEVRRAEEAAGLPVTVKRVREATPEPYTAGPTSGAVLRAARLARAAANKAEREAKAERKRAAREEDRAAEELNRAGSVFAALVSCAMERAEVSEYAAVRFYLDADQGEWWGDGAPGTIAHIVNAIEAAIIEQQRTAEASA